MSRLTGDHYFRIHREAKWHRGIGNVAWCSTSISSRRDGVEWEIRRPHKNLCQRCFPEADEASSQ